MKCAHLSLFAAALFSAAASAQYPMPGPDPRYQQVEHRPGSTIPLRVSEGYQLTLGFGPDERIESVAVGDSGAWQVTANKRADYLFVKPSSGANPTNMTVITDVDVYSFELSLAEGTSGVPYVVRVMSAPSASPASLNAPPTEVAEPGRYRVGGTRAIRPVAISDDSRQTYIEWSPNAPLPAVYGITRTGEEVLTNGEMIEGRFVLDTVYERLVFRLENAVARATRMKPRPKPD